MSDSLDLITHLVENDDVKGLLSLLLSDDRYISQLLDNLPDLVCAAMMRSGVEINELLWDLGGDYNTLTSDGTSPLHLVARWHGPESLQAALEAGGDVNVRDSEGRTPLWNAVDMTIEQNVKFLIQNGADTTILDYYGFSIFDYCYQYDDTYSAATLLELGLDYSQHLHSETRDDAIQWFKMVEADQAVVDEWGR